MRATILLLAGLLLASAPWVAPATADDGLWLLSFGTVPGTDVSIVAYDTAGTVVHECEGGDLEGSLVRDEDGAWHVTFRETSGVSLLDPDFSDHECRLGSEVLMPPYVGASPATYDDDARTWTAVAEDACGSWSFTISWGPGDAFLRHVRTQECGVTHGTVVGTAYGYVVQPAPSVQDALRCVTARHC